MDDKMVKAFLGLAVEYGREIGELLQLQDRTEIERGIVAIPQDLCNDLISNNLHCIKGGAARVKNVNLKFEKGFIGLQADAEVDKLGPIQAEYMMEINDLRFNKDSQLLYATFTENITSGGNMLQQAALKAATVGGTALGKVTKLAKIDFVYVDGNRLMVDFSKVDKIKKAADSLELTYRSCENGLLKLQFQLV